MAKFMQNGMQSAPNFLLNYKNEHCTVSSVSIILLVISIKSVIRWLYIKADTS